MPVKKEIVRTGWREVCGIFLVGLCVLVLLSLISYRPEDISLVQSPPNSPALNFIGPVGAWIAYVIFMGLGVVGYGVSAILGITGLLLIFKREGRVWPKVLWMLAILVACLCLVELKDSAWTEWTRRLDIGGPGGALGEWIAQDFLIRFLGVMGAGTLATVVLIAGISFLMEVHPIILFRHVATVVAVLYKKSDTFLAERRDKREQIEREQREIAKRRRRLEEVMKDQESAKQKGTRPQTGHRARRDHQARRNRAPGSRRNDFVSFSAEARAIEAGQGGRARNDPRPWRFPPPANPITNCRRWT